MDFLQFASVHGLIINHIEYGKWVRVSTEDKPRKRNGAYKHMGDVAWVQNHATMSEPDTWFPDADATFDASKAKAIREKANRDLSNTRADAARKAQWIISQCKHEQHAYLERKGFPDAQGLVWRPEEQQNLLVIPMRVGREVVGCQLIDRNSEKRFLSGQRCSGAEYVIDARGPDIWCEGYATGLSIKACLDALRARYTLHVCFSAGNLQGIAKKGFVVADNDESGTGERAAKATGLPYFLPPALGQDFNDLHKQIGTFKASQMLRMAMLRAQQ